MMLSPDEIDLENDAIDAITFFKLRDFATNQVIFLLGYMFNVVVVH